jgi:hypothetical protein
VDSSEEVLFLTSFGDRDAFASVSFLRSMALILSRGLALPPIMPR